MEFHRIRKSDVVPALRWVSGLAALGAAAFLGACQDDALMTSDGGTAPVVLAPGAWTVGAGMDALFTAAMPDRGEGLEGLAEDGAVSGLNAELDNRTGLTSPMAPGVYAVHSGSSVLFTSGSMDRGAFNTPEGAAGPAPAFPGDAYVFTVSAMPGSRLSLATMLVQSNDLFFAPADGGVALFDAGGIPVAGDVTGEIFLWDAGTEVNEFPGVGPNQAPRQGGANTGADEAGDVTQVDDGFAYPQVDEVVRVTITPISTGS